MVAAVPGEFERVEQSADRRSVDLATVWLHYDGGIAALSAGSASQDAWSVRLAGGGFRGLRVGGFSAAHRGHQPAPNAERPLFCVSFLLGPRSRVNPQSPLTSRGGCFCPLCVAMIYGLGVGCACVSLRGGPSFNIVTFSQTIYNTKSTYYLLIFCKMTRVDFRKVFASDTYSFA